MPTLTAERRSFFWATCLCLAAAVLGFAALSALLLKTGSAWALLGALGRSKMAWLALAVTFLVLGWLAVFMLERGETTLRRCLGLGFAVLADALLFAPVFARVHATAIGLAASIGAVVLVIGCGVVWAAFGPLRAPAWLDKALTWAGLAALATVVVSIGLRHAPGPWALGALFAFAALTLVHHGAQLLRNASTDRPAGTALSLFASAALVQWAIGSVLRLRRPLARH